jgi:hypothetical protein
MTDTDNIQLEDLIDDSMEEQLKPEELERYLAEGAIATASDVPSLCEALNAFEDLRKTSTFRDGLEISIPIFAEAPDVDWEDFADEPVSCDEEFVLFEEQGTGRYYYKRRADVESTDGE